MADFISAVAQQGAATNRVVEVTNPAASPDIAKPQLSDTARAALERIGEMHASYDAEIAHQNEVKGSTGIDEIVAADNPAESVATAAKLMTAQMEASHRVQAQLTQFVMVSSVSSSFGKNLNMFLRGQ